MLVTGTLKRRPSLVLSFPWTAVLQSLDPFKMSSGTRITGFPPFDKSTVTVPLLPTAYCIHDRILKEKLHQECAQSSLNTGWTDSVLEELEGQGVYAYRLVFCGWKILRHRSVIFVGTWTYWGTDVGHECDHVPLHNRNAIRGHLEDLGTRLRPVCAIHEIIS